jgi:uncharacterized coiled-coil protein SlyX
MNEFQGERRAGMLEMVAKVAQQGEQINNLAGDVTETKSIVSAIQTKLNNGLTKAVEKNTEHRIKCEKAEEDKKEEKSKHNWQLLLAIGTSIVSPIITAIIILRYITP